MRIRRYLVSVRGCARCIHVGGYAGPCLDEIGAMQAKIDAKLEAIATAGPPATAQRHGETQSSSTNSTLHSWSGGKDGEIRPDTVQAIQQGMAY